MKKSIKTEQLQEALAVGALSINGSAGNFDTFSFYAGAFTAFRALAEQGFMTEGQRKWLDLQFMSFSWEGHNRLKKQESTSTR